jgi:hypothetical protein
MATSSAGINYISESNQRVSTAALGEILAPEWNASISLGDVHRRRLLM